MKNDPTERIIIVHILFAAKNETYKKTLITSMFQTLI